MHTKMLVRIGLLLAAAPCAAQTPSIPTQFQGKWGSSLDSCKIDDVGGLTISPNLLRFWESRGKVLAVRVLSPLVVEIDLDFTGEGGAWKNTLRFALSPDHKTLTDPTDNDPVHKVTRVRCP